MATRKLTPRKAADEVLGQLRRHANKATADSYQRYFKEPVAFFGLTTEDSREIKNHLLAWVTEIWKIRDAVRFCNAMVRDPHLEPRGIGYQVVAQFVTEATPELLVDVERWLGRSCGNWALVDNLAPSVLGPLLDLHPSLIPKVVSWTDSPNLWIRRGAAVAFIPLVKKKAHRRTAYKIASRLLDDNEDLMHKAVGWLLRESGKSDMAQLERFLCKNGPAMPRTTVRYAIERFPAIERKRLLKVTRGEKAGRRS